MKMAARFYDKNRKQTIKMFIYRPADDLTLKELARIVSQLIEPDIDWLRLNPDLSRHFIEYEDA